MLTFSYDSDSDVLYVAKNGPCRAFSSEEKDGLLLRFDYETHKPCGVTILGYQADWTSRLDKLTQRVAELLGCRVGELNVIRLAFAKVAEKEKRDAD